MSKIINIAVLQNRKARTQKLEFNLDKDYIEIECKDYNRARVKELTRKESEMER